MASVESDNRAKHVTKLRLSGLVPGSYALLEGSKTISALEIKGGEESVVEIPLTGDGAKSFTIRAK